MLLMLVSSANEKNLTDVKLPHQIKIKSIYNSRFFKAVFRYKLNFALYFLLRRLDKNVVSKRISVDLVVRIYFAVVSI